MDRLDMQGAMAVIKRAQSTSELSASQSKGLELSGSADGFSNDLLAAIRSVNEMQMTSANTKARRALLLGSPNTSRFSGVLFWVCEESASKARLFANRGIALS